MDSFWNIVYNETVRNIAIIMALSFFILGAILKLSKKALAYWQQYILTQPITRGLVILYLILLIPCTFIIYQGLNVQTSTSQISTSQISTSQTTETVETNKDISKIDLRDYFPTKYTKLTYFFFTGKNQDGFEELRNIYKMDESKYKVAVENPITPKTMGFEYIYEINKNEIRLISTGMSGKIETTNVLILSNYTLEWSPEKSRKIKITALGQTVTTSAGTFNNCIEVTDQTDWSTGTTYKKSYYAPNLGLVKQIVKNPGNTDYINFSELKKYSSGN
jgi:hypothetical protein